MVLNDRYTKNFPHKFPIILNKIQLWSFIWQFGKVIMFWGAMNINLMVLSLVILLSGMVNANKIKEMSGQITKIFQFSKPVKQIRNREFYIKLWRGHHGSRGGGSAGSGHCTSTTSTTKSTTTNAITTKRAVELTTANNSPFPALTTVTPLKLISQIDNENILRFAQI